MKHLKFKPGEFITQSTSRNGSFAIFEGEVYEPTEKGGPNEYSLMCFYNPEHYTQDSDGKFNKEYVFECDVDDDTCQYIIDDNDMDFWRGCTEQEKHDALKFLAENKHIAYDEKTKTFRKLTQGERISFDAPKPTAVNPAAMTPHRGSESFNPFYGRGHGPGTVGNTPVKETKKYITRIVKDDWEQKEPITNMDDEHREMLDGLCEKLKYEFNYSSVSTGVMRYPTNGSQVPMRQGFDACGWPMGQYGMMDNFCGWACYD
jgi:hypothetical protein